MTYSTTSTPGRGAGETAHACLSAQLIASQMQLWIPRSKFANKNLLSYEQIAEQYIKSCGQAIKVGILKASKESIEQGYFYIDMNWLRDQNTSKYRYNGKFNWWFDWLMHTCPMFTVVARGYHKAGKGVLTKVKLLETQGYERIVDETPEQTFQRAYDGLSEEFNNANVEYVPVDPISLTNYIGRTKVDTKMDQTKRYQYELQAREILAIAEYVNANTDLGYAIPHIPSPSRFGRTYYRGFNLQNCPSVVREAALGGHTKYDVVSSVFAWQLAMVNNQFLTPATKELVLERQRIRHMLANDCIKVHVSDEFKITLIKQAITAIGFGAGIAGGGYWDTSSNSWVRNAIADIIRNPDDRLRFQEHPWVKEFVLEQKAITEHIKNLVDLASLPQDIELFNKRNQIRTSKLMAYLYQHYEYDLIDQIRKEIDPAYGWLLTVHDGFYLKHKFTGTRMREVALAVNEYVRIEGETHGQWQDQTEIDYKQKQRAIVQSREYEDEAVYDTSLDPNWTNNQTLDYFKNRYGI